MLLALSLGECQRPTGTPHGVGRELMRPPSLLRIARDPDVAVSLSCLPMRVRGNIGHLGSTVDDATHEAEFGYLVEPGLESRHRRSVARPPHATRRVAPRIVARLLLVQQSDQWSMGMAGTGLRVGLFCDVLVCSVMVIRRPPA